MSAKRNKKTTIFSIASVILALAGAASAMWAAYDEMHDTVFIGISAALILAAGITNIVMIRSRQGDEECAS